MTIPEGQLCPYCENYVILAHEGWWRCGVCDCDFWAVEVDSDFSDYHCFFPDERRAEQPAYPSVIPIALPWG